MVAGRNYNGDARQMFQKGIWRFGTGRCQLQKRYGSQYLYRPADRWNFVPRGWNHWNRKV